jgi:ABC-type nitrate/sulfonate/bicarbonate transport system ATPase subunit
VTHDVEEALFLADRVVVISPRPGRIVNEVLVSFDRPRNRGNPDFARLKAMLEEDLLKGAVGTEGAEPASTPSTADDPEVIER